MRTKTKKPIYIQQHDTPSIHPNWEKRKTNPRSKLLSFIITILIRIMKRIFCTFQERHVTRTDYNGVSEWGKQQLSVSIRYDGVSRKPRRIINRLATTSHTTLIYPNTSNDNAPICWAITPMNGLAKYEILDLHNLCNQYNGLCHLILASDHQWMRIEDICYHINNAYPPKVNPY